ncbi:Molybdopterin-guanine dinucleotide biosynthesis protein A [Raineyella antarctica]|uniref:Molybdopterin-guanine dinucleotide biosynthesis protein A n=1 Tax=Raineyella antarctica TaxID=1577474 RepID=A0A1G6HZH9_9ACTN|nr:NTP transferase domain-containing protein [Raineyella antarctica]SDB98886.1 Molybdopterin-guanine dinucleotide biosynthesis protein A [Raineyella antarctica]
MTWVTYDAIILAGGRARRLEGACKPEVILAGRRLLDHTLDSTTGARHRVVVGPAALEVPATVLQTQETPAHGGPVAGIEAGLQALSGTTGPRSVGDGTPILVLACDMPFIASALPRLLAHLDGVDGTHLVDHECHPQWLAALYRPDALQRGLDTLAADGGTRNASVRRLVAGLAMTAVATSGPECSDVDTWADHAHLETVVPPTLRAVS